LSEVKKQIKFTKQQEAAINHRGGSLLVSSGAGSGKTKVIVERLLGYINEGYNIDDFLIITYTRAAALELRSRIYDEIMERLIIAPENTRLRRQSMLVRCANIDTIHAFCGIILRENAYLVDLPSDFRVADENESDIIKNEVLDEMLSRTYERIHEDFGLKTLLELIIEGRDDKKLEEILLDIHRRLMSIPKPEKWVENQIEKSRITGSADISEFDFGKFLIEKIKRTVQCCFEKMLEIKEEMQGLPDFEASYGSSINETLSAIDALHKALQSGSWDEAARFRNVEFSRPKQIRGYDELKEKRNWCKGELGKCSELLEYSSADHIADMKELAPAYEALLRLVIEFNKDYAAEKKKRGIVDFSDLEHLTLSVLLSEDAENKKTKIAETVSKRFKEIMIDEYQDVNDIQDRLFNAISQDCTNLFMVGDVKQSIYRFRLAEPAIFLDKYKKFAEFNPSNKNNTNTKIDLSSNFRSHAGILNTVNNIFYSIMSQELGELNYTQAQALIPGRSDSEKGKQGKKGKQGIENAAVELDLLSLSGLSEAEDEESPTAVQIEACHVAGRINEMIKTPYMIPDKGGNLRPIEYSDIAILTRSVKGISWQYANALTDIGIPVDISRSEDFFNTVEVTAILSLLSVIDNPLQDIPLAAVLSGPVYRFSSTQLAEIRAINRNINYYDALIRSQEPDMVSQATACKCKRLLDELEEMREAVADMSSDRFIWYVYNKTGLPGIVRAKRDGERRHENLLKIVECAASFEQSGYKGVFSFLGYINGLKERGVDIGSSSGEQNTNAVRILSIHKSKGLEFPVVFLVNTAKKHNYMDTMKPLIFHKELGIGSMYIDRERRIKYSTLKRRAIAEKLKTEMLSEELRVLYVAMTRAMEKLVITATYADADKRFEKIANMRDKNGKFAPQALATLTYMADWILAGLIDETEDVTVNRHCIEDNSIEAVRADENSQEKHNVSGQGNTETADIKFDFVYPHMKETVLPSKLTVTGIEKLIDLEAQSVSWIREETAKSGSYRVPSFISKAETTATQRGTLLHDIMRYIDYDKCSNEDEISASLELLTKRGILDEREIEKSGINLGKIVTLFKSDLGKRMLSTSNMKREFKFSLLTPANEYFPDAGSDKILLQGVIDCFFEEDGEYVVVDYKTDNITKDTVAKRAEKYTPQLEAYAKAIERITAVRVKEKIIYFFAIDTSISV